MGLHDNIHIEGEECSECSNELEGFQTKCFDRNMDTFSLGDTVPVMGISGVCYTFCEKCKSRQSRDIFVKDFILTRIGWNFLNQTDNEHRSLTESQVKGFEAIERLKENWDSYNAKPPSPKTIEKSKALCVFLGETCEMSPQGDGSIELFCDNVEYDILEDEDEVKESI